MKNSYRNVLALPPNIIFNVAWQADATVDQAGVDAYVDTLGRPGWYAHDYSNKHDTRLYMLEVHQPFATMNVSGKIIRCWHCERYDQPVLYDGIHIGHKTKWKEELKKAGVLDLSEEKVAYNNLKNLLIECATCNTSHDWE